MRSAASCCACSGSSGGASPAQTQQSRGPACCGPGTLCTCYRLLHAPRPIHAILLLISGSPAEEVSEGGSTCGSLRDAPDADHAALMAGRQAVAARADPAGRTHTVLLPARIPRSRMRMLAALPLCSAAGARQSCYDALVPACKSACKSACVSPCCHSRSSCWPDSHQQSSVHLSPSRMQENSLMSWTGQLHLRSQTTAGESSCAMTNLCWSPMECAARTVTAPFAPRSSGETGAPTALDDKARMLVAGQWAGMSSTGGDMGSTQSWVQGEALA